MAVVPLRADQIQSPDDPVRALAERREAAIAREIAAALEQMGDALDARQLEKLIGHGDYAGVGRLLDSNSVRDALGEAYKPVISTYQDAAQSEFDRFRGTLPLDTLGLAMVIVPARNTFVQNLVSQAKNVVRDQFITMLRQGADPEEIALHLKQVIGLNPRQAKAVENFRRLLLEGDRTALTRALRDKRFDATVERWLTGQSPVDEAKVEAMVERYADRMLTHRAETIARTESMNAATGGVREAYVQAVKTGRLLDSEVKKFWLTAADERVCPVCASIPILNEGGISVLRPYLSIGGPVMGPTVHPSCRCTEKFVADLSRVTQTPFDMPMAA